MLTERALKPLEEYRREAERRRDAPRSRDAENGKADRDMAVRIAAAGQEPKQVRVCEEMTPEV